MKKTNIVYKLKKKYYELIKEDEKLQDVILQLPVMKHQNYLSLTSMAHVEHYILSDASIVKIIKDYCNADNLIDTTSPIQVLNTAA